MLSLDTRKTYGLRLTRDKYYFIFKSMPISITNYKGVLLPRTYIREDLFSRDICTVIMKEEVDKNGTTNYHLVGYRTRSVLEPQ